MNEPARLAHVLRTSWDGDAWYGPSAARVLATLHAGRASGRVRPDVHTAWELALHVGAWLDEVRSLLGGAPPRFEMGFDWPDAGEPTEERWREAVAALGEAHEACARAIEELPAERLLERVGPPDEVAAGKGITIHELLVGVIQHDAYHLGQIALLAKESPPVGGSSVTGVAADEVRPARE
jgi:uncharacterized damage-inducible protein DinB